MSLLPSIVAQALRHAPGEGETATCVPGLKLIRASTTGPLQRGILEPSVCAVVQGGAVFHPGPDVTLRYDAGTFLATSIDMPVMVGEITRASAREPFLVLSFKITPHDVLSVLDEVGIATERNPPRPKATFVGECDAPLLDVIWRSVRSLDDEREARFLGPLLRRELIYRLVTGPSARQVCDGALLGRVDDGVGRTVSWIRSHFKESLSVQALAKRAKMSESSLQHKFKATVMMGPLQYQKRLRLEEARRLLFSGRTDATGAAFAVGYESSSQFNREYRRLFGLPPVRHLKQVRGELCAIGQ